MILPLFTYEDVIDLNIPAEKNLIDLDTLNWKQYNPRKKISRFGCSITSLNGEDTGIPDLDSIPEYNKINGTAFSETSFKIPTKHASPFNYFLSNFEVGRSHYLKLDSGGFFPWHRDNDPETFRIIYTIKNCESNNLLWIEDEKLLHLKNHNWYYINTHKKHCVFSLGGSVFAVFNVLYTDDNILKLFKHASVK